MLSAKQHIYEHSLVCKLNNYVTFTKRGNLSTKAFFFPKKYYILQSIKQKNIFSYSVLGYVLTNKYS